MQSILLQRRLKTHYSLLIPFPPLPFAYPPRRRPEELRLRTGSPLPPVTQHETQIQDGVPMHEMDRPDGPARSTAQEEEADPFARRDAIEEIPPSPDQSATSVKPSTASSGPPPEEEVLIVEFSKLYDPLNPQASFPGILSFVCARVQVN